MICPNCGKEMTIESVETSPAHQGFSADGSGIVDATYEDMYWCDNCNESQPLKSDPDDFDSSDDARDQEGL